MMKVCSDWNALCLSANDNFIDLKASPRAEVEDYFREGILAVLSINMVMTKMQNNIIHLKISNEIPICQLKNNGMILQIFLFLK